MLKWLQKGLKTDHFNFQCRRSDSGEGARSSEQEKSAEMGGEKEGGRTPGTCERYLTIIPRARMDSESIAHEAEGRMGY